MVELSENDWELINAYADGELSAGEEAVVSRRLTEDAMLAAALAEIRTLKAALSQTRPAVEPVAAVRGRFTGRRFVLAASLAAAVVLGAFYQLTGSGEDWRDAPAELHATLSAQTYVLPDGNALPVISTARIGSLKVFDLSSSRLSLVDVRTTRRDQREVVAMHYRGQRGCRLTVVALEALPGDPAVPPARHDGLSARWSVERAHFYLLANGMDRARFDAIAAYAKAQSQPPDRRDSLELAVRSATEKAQPCSSPAA
jgi:anti-sigma factor RsiW